MIIGSSRLRRGGHRLPVFGGGSAGTPYSIPNYFTTTSIFPYSVIDTNGVFTSTFAASNFKDSGGPFYISPSGNDTTGDGSSGNPWKTISKALTAAATGSLINMAAGRYQMPAPTDGAGKSMSFQTATLGTAFVGNLLANADVSSWGTPASGRQQITLTSGTIAGYTDTTKVDPTTTVYQTSLDASSAANIATFQAAGQCGIFRPSINSGTTAATLGAWDSRDLTNSFDTTLLAWRAGAVTNQFTGSANGKLYFENITFVGEDLIEVGNFAGAQVVLNNCNYNGGDNCIGSTSPTLPAQTKIILHNVIVVGCQNQSSFACDLIDVNCNMVAENVKTYYASAVGASSANNTYTSHGGPQMHINCVYGPSGGTSATGRLGRQGYFGGSITSPVNALNVGALSPFNIDTHIKNTTITGTITQGGLTNNAVGYAYDATTAAKTVVNGPIINRSGSKPTSQQTLFYLDPSQIGTLFQDTTGTVPVTANGQNVMRINCGAGTGSFVTVGTQAGTVVYNTDGTYFWLTTALARFVMNIATPLAEDTSIIIGLNSTDGSPGSPSFILTAIDSSTFADFRNTGNPWSNCAPYPVSANGGFAVNAGTPSFLATIKTAACNGSNNVFTLRKTDMMWTPWRTATLLAGFGTGTTSTTSLDGKIFGARIVAYGTDAEIKAAEQAMGAKMGTVIP